MTYDEKFGTLSEIAGFEIMRESSVQRIVGNKVKLEKARVNFWNVEFYLIIV